MLLLGTGRVDEAQAAIGEAQAIGTDEIVNQVAVLIAQAVEEPKFLQNVLGFDTDPAVAEIALGIAHDFQAEDDDCQRIERLCRYVRPAGRHRAERGLSGS